jgi:hypothetical protein
VAGRRANIELPHTPLRAIILYVFSWSNLSVRLGSLWWKESNLVRKTGRPAAAGDQEHPAVESTPQDREVCGVEETLESESSGANSSREKGRRRWNLVDPGLRAVAA